MGQGGKGSYNKSPLPPQHKAGKRKKRAKGLDLLRFLYQGGSIRGISTRKTMMSGSQARGFWS